MSAPLRRLLPTPAWARAALVPALVFIALATDRNYLADFWHHLARGRAIVDFVASLTDGQATALLDALTGHSGQLWTDAFVL